MNTFIFTWNPGLWLWQPSIDRPYQKTLAESFQDIADNGLIFETWICRHYKKIRPGDIAILAITDKEIKGIFGSGIVCNDLPFEEKDERIGASGYVHKAWIQINTLLDPFNEPILTSSVLKDRLPEYKTPRGSGESINNDTAIKLQKLWSEFINKPTTVISDQHDNKREDYYEGTTTTIIQTIYERDRNARQKCIEHYGVSCVVCDFNFEEKYGKVGKDYIHVHHLTKIASFGKEYRIDPINALRPVCPNCHSIIHKRKEAYTIEEVKNFLRHSVA